MGTNMHMIMGNANGYTRVPLDLCTQTNRRKLALELPTPGVSLEIDLNAFPKIGKSGDIEKRRSTLRGFFYAPPIDC